MTSKDVSGLVPFEHYYWPFIALGANAGMWFWLFMESLWEHSISALVQSTFFCLLSIAGMRLLWRRIYGGY